MGRLSNDALNAHVASIDTAGAHRPVVVFNSLSHARRSLVAIDAPEKARAARAADGTLTPLQRDERGGALLAATIPPCGHQVYDLVDEEAVIEEHALSVYADHLENEHLRIELDERGLLRSVFDKCAEREVLSPGTAGNVFQLHPDYPNFYDAWDIDRFTFDQVTDLDGLQSVEVTETGPLRRSLRVTRTFGDSEIVQDIRLEAGSHFVDFATTVDWHETNRLLKVAFPVAVRSGRATYEIQYGHVERPTHDNTSWDVARFEVCGHKWADLSESGYGVALLNDCKYGYDISGNVIRLSLFAPRRGPTRSPIAGRTVSPTACSPMPATCERPASSTLVMT